MENLYGPGSEGSPPSVEEIEEGECLWGMGAARTGVVAIGTEHCPLIGCLPPKEVDILLQRCEGGVDAALQYAKDMAKYMKDLISYLDKRTTLGEGREDTRTGLWGGGVWGRAFPKPHSHSHLWQRWNLPKVYRRSFTAADRASHMR